MASLPEHIPGAGSWGLAVTASNPEGTALLLIADKCVLYDEDLLVDPCTVSDSLAHLEPKVEHEQSEFFQTMLGNILEGKHNDESDFDKKLFVAFSRCFPNAMRVTTKGTIHKLRYAPLLGFPLIGRGETLEAFIPYDPEKTGDSFAYGFSRQVVKSKLGIPDNWGGTRNNRQDHCCVVFEKREDKWCITETTGCVELKMQDTGPRLMERLDYVLEPQLASEAGSVGQAIIFALVDTWSCLSRMGTRPEPLDGEDHIKLPVSIVSGQRKKRKRTDKPGRAACASVELRIPKRCGDRFLYTVRHFAAFESGDKEDRLGYQIRTYLAQLCRATRWAASYCNRRNGGSTLEILPPSGHALPISGMQRYSFSLPRKEKKESRSTQGDIWCGTVSKAAMRDCFCQASSLFNEPPGSDSDTHSVLIKVSSRAVHPQLIPPYPLEAAINTLRFHGKLNILEDILIGMEVNVPSMTTVSMMKDLRVDGYGAVLPSNGNRRLMWEGFSELVQNLLIRLAQCDIVFFDLRPGYDITENMLSRDNKCGGVDMMLIDLESLALHRHLDLLPVRHDARYHRNGNNAFAFLFSQIFLLGYALATKTNASAVDAENILRILEVTAREQTEDEVRALLRRFQEFFDQKPADDEFTETDLKTLKSYGTQPINS